MDKKTRIKIDQLETKINQELTIVLDHIETTIAYLNQMKCMMEDISKEDIERRLRLVRLARKVVDMANGML